MQQNVGYPPASGMYSIAPDSAQCALSPLTVDFYPITPYFTLTLAANLFALRKTMGSKDLL
jgi:hypothetical protein